MKRVGKVKGHDRSPVYNRSSETRPRGRAGEVLSEVVELPLSEIHPYENNPRKNETAVPKVMNSIREFGFQQPILLTRAHVIIAGHTRYMAAQRLGLKTAPCIVCDLNDAQARALRLADNKTGELAQWDMDRMAQELEGIDGDGLFDMTDFGFDDGDSDLLSIDPQPEKKEERPQPPEPPKTYNLTIEFPAERRRDVRRYLKAQGKERIVELILDEVDDYLGDE